MKAGKVFVVAVEALLPLACPGPADESIRCTRCRRHCSDGRSGPGYLQTEAWGYTRRTDWLCVDCAPAVWRDHYARAAAVRARLDLVARSRELGWPCRRSDLTTSGVQLALWGA